MQQPVPPQNSSFEMPDRPTPGFCLKGLCRDGETKVFINVCGHANVGVPLSRSQEPIPDFDFVDLNGLDNLMIPISVSETREVESVEKEKKSAAGVSGGKKYIVDVVVHSELTKRCVPSHHRYEHFVGRLTQLALQWVQQENGLVIVPRTVTMLSNVKYKQSKKEKGGPQMSEEDMARRVRDAMSEMMKMGGGGDGSNGGPQEKKPFSGDEDISTSKKKTTEGGANIPDDLIVENKPKEAKKGPLIVELSGDGKPKPAIKRGFLNSNKGGLYGDEGSKEGAMPEDPSSDPLSNIPEQLRGKCQVVDMRNESEKKHRPIPPGASAPMPTSQQGPSATTATSSTSAAADGMGDFANASAQENKAFMDDLARLMNMPPSSHIPAAAASMGAGTATDGGYSGGSGGGILGGAYDPAPPVRSTADVVKKEDMKKPEEEKKVPETKATPEPTAAPTQRNRIAIIEEEESASTDEKWDATVDTSSTQQVQVVIITPPSVTSMKQIDLEIEEKCVECVGGIKVNLPKAIDVDGAKAKFSKKSRTLTVSAPWL